MPSQKRLSVAEKIDRIALAGEDAVFEIFQELERESVEYRGLRFAARNTQLRQDRILDLYKKFIAVIDERSLGDAPTDTELKIACFPSDHSAFYAKARRFLIFMIANASPRSSRDEHITYATACQYRDHLLFWAHRVYRQRPNTERPRSSEAFHQLTEAMRGAALRRQLGKATTAKAYIGLPEIQYMIDIDMKATPCIEVAEQHHLAWCLGRITALRPSSFGPPPTSQRERPGRHGYDDFLMWKDINITKNTTPPGSFTAKIKIRNLKTDRVDPAFDSPHELNFNILSPQNQSNIPFSVPHRLLMIALRRRALEGIETIEDLMENKDANITIKLSFLNKPVLLAASYRGLSLEKDKPMPAAALTNYIQIRGRIAGFPDKITFYSIRRRLATDLVHAYGLDAAREIMGHDPSSRTLEKSYLEFNAFRNVTALGLGEDTQGQENERRATLHQQLLKRLDGHLVEKSRGKALNAMVEESLNADLEFHKLTDEGDIAKHIRRTRRFVFDTLWEQLHQEAASKLTQDDLQQRKNDLKEASSFACRILALVKQRLPKNTTTDFNAAVQNINFDQEFPEEGDLSTIPEDDIEDRHINDDVEIQPNIDEDKHRDSQVVNENVLYQDVVRTFLEILRTNSLSTYKPNEMVKCPLCQDDPTISQVEKDHERTINHHRVHLKAKIHTPFEKFRRETQLAVEQETDRTGERARFECSFCKACLASLTDDGQNSDKELSTQSWYRFDYLVRHIEASNANSVHGLGTWKLDQDKIDMHEQLKRDAGWYDPAFTDEPERSKVRAHMQKTEAKRQGIKWTNEIELESGVSMASRPGFVRGGKNFRTHEILAMNPESLTEWTSSISTAPELLNTRHELLTTDDPGWDTNVLMGRWTSAFTDKRPTPLDLDSIPESVGSVSQKKQRRG